MIINLNIKPWAQGQSRKKGVNETVTKTSEDNKGLQVEGRQLEFLVPY